KLETVGGSNDALGPYDRRAIRLSGRSVRPVWPHRSIDLQHRRAGTFSVSRTKTFAADLFDKPPAGATLQRSVRAAGVRAHSAELSGRDAHRCGGRVDARGTRATSARPRIASHHIHRPRSI